MSEPLSGGGYLVRRILPFERDYTQVPNAYFRDERLSWKARGIVGFLMTHRDGYEMSLKSLSEGGPDGIALVRTAVEELERWGYLSRQPERASDGRWATRWELTDPRATLFDAVESTASENRTPSENRTRSAFENRTPNRTPLKNTKSSQGEYRPRPDAVDNEDAYGAPLSRPTAEWADARCPADWKTNQHELGASGRCRHCFETPITIGRTHV